MTGAGSGTGRRARSAALCPPRARGALRAAREAEEGGGGAVEVLGGGGLVEAVLQSQRGGDALLGGPEGLDDGDGVHGA